MKKCPGYRTWNGISSTRMVNGSACWSYIGDQLCQHSRAVASLNLRRVYGRWFWHYCMIHTVCHVTCVQGSQSHVVADIDDRHRTVSLGCRGPLFSYNLVGCACTVCTVMRRAAGFVLASRFTDSWKVLLVKSYFPLLFLVAHVYPPPPQPCRPVSDSACIVHPPPPPTHTASSILGLPHTSRAVAVVHTKVTLLYALAHVQWRINK